MPSECDLVYIHIYIYYNLKSVETIVITEAVASVVSGFCEGLTGHQS